MRKLIFIIVLISAISVYATENTCELLELKDGSCLIIRDNNNMKMVDRDGVSIDVQGGSRCPLWCEHKCRKQWNGVLLFIRWLVTLPVWQIDAV